MGDAEMGCVYKELCKYYDKCEPVQHVRGGLNISDCWRKNCLDGIVLTDFVVEDGKSLREYDSKR